MIIYNPMTQICFYETSSYYLLIYYNLYLCYDYFRLYIFLLENNYYDL